MKEDEFSELKHLLKESIRASNRTTHAVRSIARPTWVLILSGLLSIPWIVISAISQAQEPLLFVALTVFVGTIASIVVLRSELAKSKIPESLLPPRVRVGGADGEDYDEIESPSFEPRFWSERSWKLATPRSGLSVEDFNKNYWESIGPDEKEKVASIFRLLSRDERGLWHVAGQPDLLSLEEDDIFEDWLDKVAPAPLRAWKTAGEPSFASWTSGDFQSWVSKDSN